MARDEGTKEAAEEGVDGALPVSASVTARTGSTISTTASETGQVGRDASVLFKSVVLCPYSLLPVKCFITAEPVKRR